MKRFATLLAMVLGVLLGACSSPSTPTPTPTPTPTILPATFPPESETYVSLPNSWTGSLTTPLVFPAGCIQVHPVMISPGRGSKITPDTPLEIVFRVKFCAEAPEFEGPLYGDDLKGITFSSKGSNASRAFLSGTEEELLYAPGLRVYPGQTQEFSKKYVATIKTRPDYYMVYFYKGTDPGRFLWEPPVQGNPPLEGVRFVFPLGWTY